MKRVISAIRKNFRASEKRRVGIRRRFKLEKLEDRRLLAVSIVTRDMFDDFPIIDFDPALPNYPTVDGQSFRGEVNNVPSGPTGTFSTIGDGYAAFYNSDPVDPFPGGFILGEGVATIGVDFSTSIDSLGFDFALDDLLDTRDLVEVALLDTSATVVGTASFKTTTQSGYTSQGFAGLHSTVPFKSVRLKFNATGYQGVPEDDPRFDTGEIFFLDNIRLGVAAVSFGISALDSVKAEGQPPTTPNSFTFEVTRSGGTTGSSTVSYAVTGTSANGATDSDFVGNAFPSGTLNFAPGVTSQLVTIKVVGDLLVEPDEGFLVTLKTPIAPATITTGTALGTIVNDDTSFAIAASSAVKAEGQPTNTPTPFTFTVTRSGLTTGASTVKYAVTGSANNPAVASDFQGNLLPKGTLVFAPGVVSQEVTINVVGDALVELDESFIVTLSAPSLPATISNASAIGTIRNDDTSFAIAAKSAEKLEGQSLTSPTAFTFTVTRNGATNATNTVEYAVNGSGANPVSAGDFVGDALPSGTVTFAPGVTSREITLLVIGDSIVEENESFVVSLHTPSEPSTIATSTATGTIQNDDTAFVIAATSAVKREGQLLAIPTPYTFTVTRNGLTTVTSTVKYAVTDSPRNPAGASDFVGNVLPNGTLTFAPGETSQVITINVLGDLQVELDEEFIVTLKTPGFPATITTETAMGTIENDDTSFAISATVANKLEGQTLTQRTPFIFTVSRSGVTSVSSTVNYAIAGIGSDPATAADFVGNALPIGTVTFAPGQTSKFITVNVVGDSIVEANERFVVTLHSPGFPATITTAAAIGTIQNDDTSFAIAAKSANKPEGQLRTQRTPFIFTVSRSGVTSVSSTVSYAITGIGSDPATAADFVGNALPIGTVTFAPGQTSQLITVNVVGDSIVETNEQFVVTLHSPGFPATITTATAIGTIQNDDTSFAIAARSAIKPEGNGGGVVAFTFTVRRTGLTTGTGSVNYAVTGNLSNPARASDFQGKILPSGTIRFAAGENSKIITINVLADSLKELSEGFIVTLRTPVSGVISTSTAIGTIRNDD